MMNEYVPQSPPAPPNLKEKRTRSICLPICFSGSTHPFDVLDDDDDDFAARSTPKSPMLPEIKDRCRNFISRIGSRVRRRAASADFSYDPSSYALNFEGQSSQADDVLLLRGSSARVPPSSATEFLTPPSKPFPRPRSLDDVMEEDEDFRKKQSPAPWKEKSPKSRGVSSLIGRRRRGRSSSSSMDFSYDSSSYALNFEDDSGRSDELSPFMARLPPSPRPPPAKCSATMRPEIVAFS